VVVLVILTNNKLFTFSTAVFIIFIITGSISLYFGIINAINTSKDLQWQEGLLIAKGINPYEIYLGGSEKPSLDGTADELGPVQLPSVLSMFSILSIFNFEEAKIVWMIFNITSTLYIVYTMCKIFGYNNPWHFVLILTIFINATPWRMTIGNGQHGLIAVAFFLAAFREFQRDAFWKACIFAFFSTIKYTITFPLLLIFLIKPRFAFLLYAVLIIIHCLITIFLGFWLKEGPLILIQQSLQSASFLTSSGWLDIFASLNRIIDSNLLPITASIISIICVVILSTSGDIKILFFTASLVSTLCIYHRPYDYFVIIICVPHYIDLFNKIIKDKFENHGEISYFVLITLIFMYIFYIFRLLDYLQTEFTEIEKFRNLFETGIAFSLYFIVLFEAVDGSFMREKSP
jgi:hypothetical protein